MGKQEAGGSMSQDEKICRALIARGKWTKVNCILCRKIYKDRCPILLDEQRKLEAANGQD